MCGIIGMASLSGTKNWQDKESWFRKALLVDTLRGEHSTGIFCTDAIQPNEEPFVFKKAMAGYDFLELNKTQEIINDIDKYTFIVGHNRKATQGSTVTKNAHPFQHEHITLVHNGTLDTRNGVPGSSLIEVDSEAICYAIAKNGAKDILPKLDGAYALVWYDSLQCTLNLARNNDRPLHFAFSEDGDNMFFASEPWMIRELVSSSFKVKVVYKLKAGVHMQLDAMALDLKDYGVNNFNILPSSWGYSYGGENYVNYSSRNTKKGIGTMLEAKEKRLSDVGYTYGEKIRFERSVWTAHGKNKDRGNLFGTVDYTDVPKDIVAAYNILTLIVTGGDKDTNNLFIGTARDTFHNGSGKITIVVDCVQAYIPSLVIEPDDVNLLEGVLEDGEMVDGPGHKEITIKKFRELAKYGCCVCTGNISVDDAVDLEWTELDQPICYDCQDKMSQ